MREPITSSILRTVVAGSSCIGVLCIASSQVWAADPPPPPPQVAPGQPPPPPPAPPPAPPEEEKISFAAWVRFAAVAQNPYDPEKFNKVTANGELDFLARGRITKEIGVIGSVFANYGPTPGGGTNVGIPAIEDAIVQIEPDDLFHVWLGRMLVPSDRANFSGPWHQSPWFYPGFFSYSYLVPYGAAPPAGPRQGPVGRNDGATIWGQVGGGFLKYYAGVYNLFASTATVQGSTPLYSARVALDLWGLEPGYFNASTYYGAKDILSIGVGAQMEPGGTATGPNGGAPFVTQDYEMVNADVLVEKNLGPAGVITGEGAIYKYIGDDQQLNLSYFLLASYLTAEKMGPGKLQPLVRLQQAIAKEINGVTADAQTMIDVQLGYVVSGFDARFALGYQNQNFGAGQRPDGTMGDRKGNAIYFGAQVKK